MKTRSRALSCACCLREFLAKRPWQRFCSSGCRNKWHAEARALSYGPCICGRCGRGRSPDCGRASAYLVGLSRLLPLLPLGMAERLAVKGDLFRLGNLLNVKFERSKR